MILETIHSTQKWLSSKFQISANNLFRLPGGYPVEYEINQLNLTNDFEHQQPLYVKYLKDEEKLLITLIVTK